MLTEREIVAAAKAMYGDPSFDPSPRAMVMARKALEAAERVRFQREPLPSNTDYRIPPPDRRYMRAQQMTAHVMHIVRKYEPFDDGGDDMDCARELLDAFYTVGIEIITDNDRADAGLSPRTELGWTREELAALEAKRMVAMLQGPPPIIIAKPKTEEPK